MNIAVENLYQEVWNKFTNTLMDGVLLNTSRAATEMTVELADRYHPFAEHLDELCLNAHNTCHIDYQRGSGCHPKTRQACSVSILRHGCRDLKTGNDPDGYYPLEEAEKMRSACNEMFGYYLFAAFYPTPYYAYEFVVKADDTKMVDGVKMVFFGLKRIAAEYDD